MQQLTKKDKDYEWTEECNAALTGVKNALCTAPVLSLPNLQRPCEVVCASLRCIRCIIMLASVEVL